MRNEFRVEWFLGLFVLVLAGCGGGGGGNTGAGTVGEGNTVTEAPPANAAAGTPARPPAVVPEVQPGSAASATSPNSTAALSPEPATSAPEEKAEPNAPSPATPQAAPAEPPMPVTPATAEQAAQTLDLRTFPLLEGAATPGMRTLAQLHYEAPGKARESFAHQQKELAERDWTMEPNSYVSDESASATFRKDGFTLSLSISQAGKPGESDRVMVFYSQHGNVDSRTLPRPEGVQSLYESPLSSLYVTDAPVEETVKLMRELFLARGWEPYGTAGNSVSFKQNAIEASAMVQSAPAQGGKTVIQFGTRLLSHDLPAPADAERIQYSDSPAQLNLDWKQDITEAAKYYREQMERRGWKATTDNPIEIDWKRVLIFRNDAKDMLELELYTVEDKTRITLAYSTAAEVAEKERRFTEEMARREKEKNQPRPKVTVKLPTGAANLEQEASRLEFTVKKGTAQAAVQAIRQALVDAGWKEERSTLKPMFGDISLEKGDLSVSLGYVETGILPPEVTVSGFGVDLEIDK